LFTHDVCGLAAILLRLVSTAFVHAAAPLDHTYVWTQAGSHKTLACSLALDLQTLQQHESETLTLTKTIDSLTAQNSALTSQLSLFDEAQATLQTLQDENDCMKHAASKLPQTEKQLSLAKDKIESLLSLKDQLAATEAAHAKALDKLLTLEAEITQVPTLKKQLETYKKKAAAADVTVEDLTGELKNLKKLSAAVQRQNTTLSISSNIQLQEAAELQRLLVESYGADDDLLTAIGAGVSELNPELSEELARLRSDNELLKNKVRMTCRPRANYATCPEPTFRQKTRLPSFLTHVYGSSRTNPPIRFRRSQTRLTTWSASLLRTKTSLMPRRGIARKTTARTRRA